MSNTKMIEALKAQATELKASYQAFKAKGLALDMTRGKPCKEQLDLSLDLLTNLSADSFMAGGTDTRNYGGVDGLPEAKALMGKLLDVPAENVLIGDNSSLSLMYLSVAHAMSHGVVGGKGPWNQESPKFLCPSPGYDRHFSVCAHLGVEMIVVDMLSEGPDMDAVEKLVANDASIKGMWLVPKYSNPTGITVSDEVTERLAKMTTKASDFRLFWDNAYAVHHLGGGPAKLSNVLQACERHGNPDRVFVFGSTSKITFAGAGLAAMGGSAANIDWMRKHRSMMTIGPDKISQLRHVRLLPDENALMKHMDKHAALIRPKFDKVQEILKRELGGTDLARWTEPTGGYFVSLDTLDGCAKRVVALANEVGVKLTAAGATFPLGKDPRDRNIRIAPTLPGLSEIEQAMEVLCCCVKLASLEKHS